MIAQPRHHTRFASLWPVAAPVVFVCVAMAVPWAVVACSDSPAPTPPTPENRPAPAPTQTEEREDASPLPTPPELPGWRSAPQSLPTDAAPTPLTVLPAGYVVEWLDRETFGNGTTPAEVAFDARLRALGSWLEIPAEATAKLGRHPDAPALLSSIAFLEWLDENPFAGNPPYAVRARVRLPAEQLSQDLEALAPTLALVGEEPYTPRAWGGDGPLGPPTNRVPLPVDPTPGAAIAVDLAGEEGLAVACVDADGGLVLRALNLTRERFDDYASAAQWQRVLEMGFTAPDEVWLLGIAPDERRQRERFRLVPVPDETPVDEASAEGEAPQTRPVEASPLAPDPQNLFIYPPRTVVAGNGVSLRAGENGFWRIPASGNEPQWFDVDAALQPVRVWAQRDCLVYVRVHAILGTPQSATLEVFDPAWAIETREGQAVGRAVWLEHLQRRSQQPLSLTAATEALDVSLCLGRQATSPVLAALADVAGVHPDTVVWEDGRDVMVLPRQADALGAPHWMQPAGADLALQLDAVTGEVRGIWHLPSRVALVAGQTGCRALVGSDWLAAPPPSGSRLWALRQVRRLPIARHLPSNENERQRLLPGEPVRVAVQFRSIAGEANPAYVEAVTAQVGQALVSRGYKLTTPAHPATSTTPTVVVEIFESAAEGYVQVRVTLHMAVGGPAALLGLGRAAGGPSYDAVLQEALAGACAAIPTRPDRQNVLWQRALDMPIAVDPVVEPPNTEVVPDNPE